MSSQPNFKNGDKILFDKNKSETLTLDSYTNLIPEISAKPKTIKIYELPLNAKKLKESISLEAFLKRTGRLGWTESPLINKSSKAILKASPKLKKQMNQFTIDNDNIGYVDMGILGYGAFTLTKIKKGKRFIKGGILTETLGEDPSYVTHHSMNYPAPQVGEDKPYSIDAKYYGNALCFFQNAPSEETLNGYTFDAKTKKEKVAIRNFKVEIITINKTNFLIFESLRDIEPFELLTIEYSPYPDPLNYWMGHNITPVLFESVSFNPISTALYSYESLAIFYTHDIFGSGAPSALIPLETFKFTRNISGFFQKPFSQDFNLFTMEVSWQKLNEVYAKANEVTSNPVVIRINRPNLKFKTSFFEQLNSLFSKKFAELVGTDPNNWELTENSSRLKLKKFTTQKENDFKLHFKNGITLGLGKHLEVVEELIAVENQTSTTKTFRLYLRELAGLIVYFQRNQGEKVNAEEIKNRIDMLFQSTRPQSVLPQSSIPPTAMFSAVGLSTGKAIAVGSLTNSNYKIT